MLLYNFIMCLLRATGSFLQLDITVSILHVVSCVIYRYLSSPGNRKDLCLAVGQCLNLFFFMKITGFIYIGAKTARPVGATALERLPAQSKEHEVK